VPRGTPLVVLLRHVLYQPLLPLDLLALGDEFLAQLVLRRQVELVARREDLLSQYPKGLPPENGATHIGMFLAWAIQRELAGELHCEDSADDLSKMALQQNLWVKNNAKEG